MLSVMGVTKRKNLCYAGYSKAQYYRVLRKLRSTRERETLVTNFIPPDCSEINEDVHIDEDFGREEQSPSITNTVPLPPKNNSPSFPSADNDILDELRLIIYEGGFTEKSTNSILHFLKKHTSLPVPLSYKTLMKTPRTATETIKIGQGEYVHFGIEKFFSTFNYKQLDNLKCIELDIGIDGIRFF